MTDASNVSVVLCTRDRPALAAAAISSILEDSLALLEIVVIDQSLEPAAAVAELSSRFPVVRHIWSGTRGISVARNIGAAEARGRILVFCDDDIIAQPGWLAALASAVDVGDDERVATGRVVAGEPEVRAGFAPACDGDTEPAIYLRRMTKDVLAGGNMAIDRRTFAAVGGFDENLGPGTAFPAAEDNDLGLRLLDAGVAIAYVPEASVIHRAWREGREYPRLRWGYGLGKGGFYAKHALGHRAYGLRRAARDLGKRVLRAPIVVWRHPRQAAAELVYAAGLVVGMARWWRRGSSQ